MQMCAHVQGTHTSAQVIVSLVRVYSSTCCTETKGYVMTAEPEGSTESQKRVLLIGELFTDHWLLQCELQLLSFSHRGVDALQPS